jgi:enamine deaminase RidA (YjgF/YER057c/UK114 family)
MSAVEARLKEQGIELPNATTPAGNYVPYVINGETVYVSGQIPVVAGEV